MAKLYYRTESGRHLIKEALMNCATVERFFELYGEDEIIKAVYEKTDTKEYPFSSCFSVDED